MPPTRRKAPSNHKARVAKRVSAARQEVTGFVKSSGDGSDSDSSSSSSSSDEESEEEHVDELIQLEKFKDACWSELTSSSLEDDIANLTGKSGGKSTSENIIVGFRIRPQRNNGDGLNDDSAVVSRGQEVKISHPNSNGSKDKHSFAFDFSFGGKSTQFDVFRDLGWPCLRNAWKGFNVSIFAYGQTGSGKSHSMMGTVKNPGLIRNVGNYLFDFIDRSYADALNNGFDMKSTVTISCLEIYNEQIRDILAPFVEKNESKKAVSKPLRGGVFSKGAKAIGVKSAVERSTNLKIRESAAKGVYVEGLCSVEVTSGREMSELIDGATGNRETRATKMNDESSRSHLIFMIQLENNASGNSSSKKGKKSTIGKNISKKSKLNMIDLAGSERSKATGATGDSLKEGANINKSLSTLGRVISSLSDPKATQLAPFRDSKLTHILKDALAGNARSSMLATAHPSAIYFEETLSTLRYASSVKKIKTNASMNAEADADDIISELRSEVVKLSTQLLSYQSANTGPATLRRQGSHQELGARRRPPPKRSSIALKVQKMGGVGPDESFDGQGEVEVLNVEEVEEEEGDDKSKKGGGWLSRSMGLGGSSSVNKGTSSTSNQQDEEDRDMELASILMARDELDLQLGLRNKERVGLELQLKAKARELNKLESSLESHEAEVDDLAFALEASNTENRLLHDEISRLKRQSRSSSSSISDQVRDPQAFVKEQVMTALSSYQQVRKRNDTKEADHGKLRRQMLQSQKDPAAVVASLATNMGFWLLGQANEEKGDGLSETLALIAEANFKAMQAGEGVNSEMMKDMLHSGVKDHSKVQLEGLRAQLEESDREKEKMEAQLQLTTSHVDDLQTNVKDFSRVRVELEEQLAAQQSLLESTMQVMKNRNLEDIDMWLKSAKLLMMENSHEAQTIARLRVTVAEEEELLSKLEQLSQQVEEDSSSNKLDELNHVLAVAASRALTPERHPVVARATQARRTIQMREDALSTLELAMKSNDIELLRRVLNDALSDSVSLDKSHPVVMDAMDTVNHLMQVSELENRLSAATAQRDMSALLETIASAEALGLTSEESGPMQSAILTLHRLEIDIQAKKDLATALESGSVDMLQNALEGASKAIGLDSETREAASEAARLVAEHTSVASALRGAIASRSIELLQEAQTRAEDMLSQPTPALSPASTSTSTTSSFESSLRDSLLKTDETLSAGRTIVEGLLAEAVELLGSLMRTANAETELETAIQRRSLRALQDAIMRAEEAGVGVLEPSGLLHTGRILCTRMEAEYDATNKLVTAIHLGSDAGLLKEALNEASMMGLRGPEIAAAQAVILELNMIQKLRVAAAEKDGSRLETVVGEARDILTSAALSQSQHASLTSKHVADFLDSGRLLGPGGELEALRNISPPKEGAGLSASAKHHYALTSVAMQVFNSSEGSAKGERRRTLVSLQKELEICESQLSSNSTFALERRESEAQLAVAMLDPHLVEQQFDNLTSSLAETAALLEELMGMKVVLESLEQRLPKDLIQAFSTGAFVTSCNERYDELATGGHDEGLTPDELFPVILEMTQNAPWEITWEQCVKFADIFDADGNGVIDRNEFVGFSKFMIIGSLLESMAEIGDSLRNRTDSQGGEVVLTLSGLSPKELIERVSKNTHVVEELLPLLPEDIYNYLSGPDFIKACQTKFDETDVDGSGDLDPGELVPIILEISKLHHGDIDPERAVEFCKVFDDDGNGVLDRDEFVSLHRFVVMMITLEAATTNDVRRHPAAVERFEEEERVAMTNSNTSLNASVPIDKDTPPPVSPAPSKGRKLSVLFSDVPAPQPQPKSLSQRMGGSTTSFKAGSGTPGGGRPTLKKSDSLKQREAAEEQARVLRRQMAETSSRIEQIDAEVESLLTKVDSSEEKIGEQIQRRKSWKEQEQTTSNNMGGLFGGGTVPAVRPEPVRRRSASLLAQKYLKSDDQQKQSSRDVPNKRSGGRPSIVAQISTKTNERSAQRQKSPARHFFPQVDELAPTSTSLANNAVSTPRRNSKNVESRRSRSEARSNPSTPPSKSSPTVIVDSTSRPTIRRLPTATIRSPRASTSKASTRPTRAPSPGIRRPSGINQKRSSSEERRSSNTAERRSSQNRQSASMPRSRSSSSSRSTTSSSHIENRPVGRPSPVNRPSNNPSLNRGQEPVRGRSVGRSSDTSRGEGSRERARSNNSQRSGRVASKINQYESMSSSASASSNISNGQRVTMKLRLLSSKLTSEVSSDNQRQRNDIPRNSPRQSQSMPRNENGVRRQEL